MTLHRLDPLTDDRWVGFVGSHARSSVFHTRGWLEALHRTYDYTPLVLTSAAPGQPLHDGIVFCDVKSWLTGRRLVSLPFSDHCEPLVADAELTPFLAAVYESVHHGPWRSVEVRPHTASLASGSAFGASSVFCLHTLDLRADDEVLMRRFHRTSTQQMIRRAERERIEDRHGNDDALIQAFYRLLVVTRRRHSVPPAPIEWFRNLSRCLGAALTVRVAFHTNQPIAAIITLRHRDTAVYKYAASNAACHALGGTQLLLWHAIRDARASGCSILDLGRTEPDHQGLLTFKDRWNAVRSPVTYWRSPPPAPARVPVRAWVARWAAPALRYAPAVVHATAGKLLYRHAG